MSDWVGNGGEGCADARQETGCGNMLAKADCGHNATQWSNGDWLIGVHYRQCLQWIQKCCKGVYET